MHRLLQAIVIFILICYNLSRTQTTQIPTETKKFLSAIEIFPNFQGEWKTRMAVLDGFEKIYADGNSAITLELNSKILTIRNFLTYPSGSIVEFWILIGYNAILDKYFLFLVDNFSGMELLLTGDYSKKDKKFNFEGMSYNIETKERINVRILIFWERDDKFWFEYYTKEKNYKYKLYYKTMYVKKE
ncbi:MAG: DUF1579 family protein [Candidatus Kapaibacteriales bacterium]